MPGKGVQDENEMEVTKAGEAEVPLSPKENLTQRENFMADNVPN